MLFKLHLGSADHNITLNMVSCFTVPIPSHTAIPAIVQFEFPSYTFDEASGLTNSCLTLSLDTSVSPGVIDSLGDRVVTVQVAANSSTAVGKLDKSNAGNNK